MDLEIIILSEINHRKTNIIWYCLYAELKKKQYKWTYLQNGNIVTDIENKLVVTRRESVCGEINWETGVDIYTSLYKKQKTKDLLGGTENCSQYSAMTNMGKESWKEWL